MVRDGRSLKSLIGRHAADVEIVGYAGFITILDTMADAFVEAIRVGVPTRMLPGHSMFGSRRSFSSVDVRGEKLKALNTALVQAVKEAKTAKEYAVKAAVDDQHELSQGYHDMASARTADVLRLRRAVEELSSEPTHLPVSEQFDVRADVWVPALRRLKSCQGRMTQAERTHFQMIFPKFKMELVDGLWWAEAVMRLNTVDGVAELGPVRWPVNTQGRSTVLALNRTATVTGERRTRNELVSVLVESGGMCRDAAQTVCNAPFRELRYLLLHALCGEPMPRWVGEQWQERVFVDWIVRVYSDPDWTWSRRGKYGSSLLVRQYAANLVALHGVMSGTVLRRAMGAANCTFSELTKPFAGSNSAQRAKQPCLVDAGCDDNASRLLASVMCECGQPATVVARAPEVWTDLLCGCGRAPGGEMLGMPADLKFPDDYQDMGMTLRQCRTLMEAKQKKARATLTARERSVLGRADLLADGISARQLSKTLGVNALQRTMESLEVRGFIKLTGQQNSSRWHLTDAGTAFVAAMEG